MLQTGRSRVRVLMRSLNFFQFTESFQPHHGPEAYSTSNRNEYQKIFLGVEGGRRMNGLSRQCGILNF
jgi:hypothetical protein